MSEASCSTDGTPPLLRLGRSALLDIGELIELDVRTDGWFILNAGEQISGVRGELGQRDDAAGARQLEQRRSRHT